MDGTDSACGLPCSPVAQLGAQCSGRLLFLRRGYTGTLLCHEASVRHPCKEHGLDRQTRKTTPGAPGRYESHQVLYLGSPVSETDRRLSTT